VHFVAYLQYGLYYGLDSNESLLIAGYEVELTKLGLQAKLPRQNLVCNTDFDFGSLPSDFDFAIAQSLFTHLPRNHIRLCLHRLAAKMVAGGKLFATFFIVTDDYPYGDAFEHPAGVISFDAADPYHYRFRDILQICEDLPWRAKLRGDWRHPRNQLMVEFERIDDFHRAAHPEQNSERFQSFESAKQLPAGANHYRAYVGPPDRFDFMSGTQFCLLFSLGLRDHHRVLDFGCGSLRLGRLLIPYLQPGGYYGIDPNQWLIADAVRCELGYSVVQLKQPHFDYNSDFRCDVFGDDAKFDFVVAQSIVTHCGEDLAQKLFCEVSKVMGDNGKFLFSVIEDSEPTASPGVDGWVYPGCVAFGVSQLEKSCANAQLKCRRLPWFHPGAVWFIAAREEAALPSPAELRFLSGAVLFDRQFELSRRES